MASQRLQHTRAWGGTISNCQRILTSAPIRPHASQNVGRGNLNRQAHAQLFSGKIGPFRVYHPEDPWFTKRYWWAISVLGIAQGAYSAHSYLKTYIYPLPPIDDSADAEEASRANFEAQISRLSVVKQMRSPDSGYIEWTAYSSMSEEARKHRISTGPMGNWRCLGNQQLFYSEKEKRLVNVVYFGPASAGWPGVVHGGATAIVLDETCGRVAVRSMSSRTGVTANLQIDYKAKMKAGGIYIIEAELDPVGSTDRKALVKGTLSDQNGKLMSRVSGVFVTPTKFKLDPIPPTF